jgi:hypothetical protein
MKGYEIFHQKNNLIFLVYGRAFSASISTDFSSIITTTKLNRKKDKIKVSQILLKKC